MNKLPQPPPGGPQRHYGFWMNEALGREEPEAQRQEGAETADVLIVGGGYVGLWTAIRIAELDPALRVTVIEADLCGSGASGRNGGFAFGWWPKIETLIDRVGSEEALVLADAADQAVFELGEFCGREGIDADFTPGGWIWTATSGAQRGAWRGAMKTARGLGSDPFKELSPDELRDRTGSPVHLGGVFEAKAATVQPAILARGLRQAAVRRGVRVCEKSPVLSMDGKSGTVKTASGTVRASSIVLATNAWLAGIPELRRAIVPLSSDVVVTGKMSGELAASGWTGREAISDSRLMVHYYRTTSDGRVVLGKGGGGLGTFGRVPDEFEQNSDRIRQCTQSLRHLVPSTREVAIEDGWGGAVDRSTDGLPFFGTLKSSVPVYYGAGFSGNGVVPSLLAGRILASLALGRQDEWSHCGLARGIPGKFPPEPFRSAGGWLVRDAVRRKESKEDSGRKVGFWNAKIASLAPSGFFKPSDSDES